MHDIYTFIYSRDKRRKKELEKKEENESEYNVENDRRKQYQ